MKTLIKNGTVPLAVAMCIPYRYLSTMLFHISFLCFFVNGFVDFFAVYKSTCKHFIKTYWQFALCMTNLIMNCFVKKVFNIKHVFPLK